MRFPVLFVALSTVLGCTTEPLLEGDLHVAMRIAADLSQPQADVGPVGLPGVPVTLDDIRGTDDRMAVTDENGLVTFAGVAFGSYTVLIPPKVERSPGDTVRFFAYEGRAGRDIALPPYDTVDLRGYIFR